MPEETKPGQSPLIYLVDEKTAPTLFLDVTGDVDTKITDVTPQTLAGRYSVSNATSAGVQLDERLSVSVEEFRDPQALYAKVHAFVARTHHPFPEPYNTQGAMDHPWVKEQFRHMSPGRWLQVARGAQLFMDAGLAVPENPEFLINAGTKTLDAPEATYYQKALKYLADRNLQIPDMPEQMIALGKEAHIQGLAVEYGMKMANKAIEVRGASQYDQHTDLERAVKTRFLQGLDVIEPAHKEFMQTFGGDTEIHLGTRPEAIINSMMQRPGLEDAVGVRTKVGDKHVVGISGHSIFAHPAAGNWTIAEEIGHLIDNKMGEGGSYYNEQVRSETHFNRDLERTTTLIKAQDPELHAAIEAEVARLPKTSLVMQLAEAHVANTYPHLTDEERAPFKIQHARETVVNELVNQAILNNGYDDLFQRAQEGNRAAYDTLWSERLNKLNALKQWMVGENGEGRLQAGIVIDTMLPQHVGHDANGARLSLSAMIDNFNMEAQTRVEQARATGDVTVQPPQAQHTEQHVNTEVKVPVEPVAPPPAPPAQGTAPLPPIPVETETLKVETPSPPAAKPTTPPSTTTDIDTATKPTHSTDALRAHHARLGGNVGSTVVDGYRAVSALVNGDYQTAASSGASATLNGVAVADDLMAAAGKSTGSVSKLAGNAGLAIAVVNAGAQVAVIEAGDAINKRQQQGEVLATTALGIGSGMGGAALATSAATAAGATGFVAGAVATGGALVAAAAVTAAAAAANHYIDSAMYGAEDQRFAANFEQKTHMRGMAGRFHNQLADPTTGKIDWNNIEVLNKYSVLIQRDLEQQEQVYKDNDSMLPRWMRSGASVEAQQDAKSNIQIAESAKAELQQHINEMNARKTAQENAMAKINGLDLNNDKAISLEDLDRDKNGKLDAADIKLMRDALKDDRLADALLGNLKKQGIEFKGEVIGQVMASTSTGVGGPQQTVER